MATHQGISGSSEGSDRGNVLTSNIRLQVCRSMRATPLALVTTQGSSVRRSVASSPSLLPAGIAFQLEQLAFGIPPNVPP